MTSLYDFFNTFAIYFYGGTTQLLTFFGYVFNGVITTLVNIVLAPVNIIMSLFSLGSNSELSNIANTVTDFLATSFNPSNPLIGVCGFLLSSFGAFALLKLLKGFIGGWI